MLLGSPIRSVGPTQSQLSLYVCLCVFFLNPQSLPVRSRDLLMLVMRLAAVEGSGECRC
jgi:hypothetical protein